MEPTRPPLPPRNPETRRRHEQDVFWQITFPVALMTLALLALVTLVVLAATGGNWAPLSVLADTALVWMSLPVLLITLITVAVLIGLVVAVVKIIEVLPPYFAVVQHYARLMLYYVRRYTRVLVNLMLTVQGRAAQAQNAAAAPARIVRRLAQPSTEHPPES